MTEQKRARGRPKKAAENPDCEVATKGYVKCVARKLGEHTHENFKIKMSDGVLAFVGIVGLISIGEAGYILDQISIPTLLMTFVFFGMYSLVAGMVTSHGCTETSYDLDEVKAIQPHTEPPCEPKRECE